MCVLQVGNGFDVMILILISPHSLISSINGLLVFVWLFWVFRSCWYVRHQWLILFLHHQKCLKITSRKQDTLKNCSSNERLHNRYGISRHAIEECKCAKIPQMSCYQETSFQLDQPTRAKVAYSIKDKESYHRFQSIGRRGLQSSWK